MSTTSSLGGFATNFAGEAVSVQGMTFTISTSTASLGNSLITSVSLADDNGVVVAGPVDATWVAGNSQQLVTFTDTVTFPVGRKVYTLKGKIPSGAVNGASIVVSTTPSGWTNPTGQTSGNSVTIGTTAFNLNTMTVKGAAISVNMSTTPSSQNIVAGAQNYVFANVQLDASQSGEDVRLASVPVNFVAASGAAASDLTGCQIWDGTTALNSGSRVVNSLTSGTDNTFSFDQSFVIPKGTKVKTLAISCNVSSSAAQAGTYKFGINSSASISPQGVTSGTTIGTSNGLTLPTVTTYGGTMTVANGSLSVSVDPSSPAYTVAAAGSTGVTAGIVKFRSSNEALNLQKVGLSITTSTASSTDVGTAYLYAGNNIKDGSGNAVAAGTLLGTVTFTGNNSVATSTLNTVAQLPKDVDATIVVKVDLAGIGSSLSGTAGHLVKIDPLNAEASGVGSGQTIRVAATSGVAGIRTFRTFPTLASDTLSSSGVADGKLIRFKVTADSHGAVGLYQMKFTLSTTTASVTNIALYGYTDSSYSQGIGSLTNAKFGTTVSTAVNGTAFAMTQSTPVQVPAGSTYYFELRGSVAGVTTGSSVVTTLLGDSSYFPTTNGQYPYYVATSTNSALGNFIWSGNSTTTATTNDVDWSNGFSIPGLSQSGMVQTRSN
jgi:hypothetical protein